MSDKFNADAAQRRYNVLLAARQRAVADLADYEANDDLHNAADTVGQIAELDRSMQNLGELAKREHARMNPAHVPETESEWQNKSPERMNYNDTLRIISKSKYAQPHDVEVRNLQAGIAELQRRKQSGDVQT